MPRKPMLITLDSRSVQLRPNPALPVTAPFGVVPKSPDPKTSRMPSPVPGPMATLFWIVLFPIWADDLNERTTPKATLLLITASRMVTDDPLNATMPACETGLPFPVMVLDRKSTRLNSSHLVISYAVFCLKKKKGEYSTTDCA